MIVNVAPCLGLSDETLQALRFSSLASQVIVQSNAVTDTDISGASTEKKTHTASQNIQRQLREQLVKQGFKPRLVPIILLFLSCIPIYIVQL